MKALHYFVLILAVLAAGRVEAQGSLSLAESKRLALENNAACARSELEIEAARQVKKAAFTKYFPEISAGGAAWSAKENLLEMSVGGATMGMLEDGRIGQVTAVQPVFTGGRIRNGNRLAALDVEVNEERRRLARDQVALRTEELYWQVVSLQEKQRTIDGYEKMLASLLEQVTDAYDAGLVLKNDRLKVSVELSGVRLGASKLANARSLTLMALCQHIGIEYDEALHLDEALLIADTPQDCFVATDEALTRRAEYVLLEKSVKAERLLTRMKRGEFLPQAGVGASWIGMKLDDADSRDDAMVFGTVSVPLSGWWGGSHELKERAAREKIAETNFEDNSELLTLQIEKARRDLSDAYLQVSLSAESEMQAEENLSVSEDSYENGLITLTDLLDAMAWRQKARDEVTEAQAGYLVKRRIYLQSTGR